jgi:RecA/RadA recombinase
MQSGKDFKVVIAGEFGSGRTTFASRFVVAKQNKQKVGEFFGDFVVFARVMMRCMNLVTIVN